MTGLVKRVNDRIEIREAGKYDRERNHHWVLAFISPNGSANLSSPLGVEDMRQLREAMLDSRFLPPVDDETPAGPAPYPIVWVRHPGGAVDACPPSYTTHVLGAHYRIERDGRQWALWIRESGSDKGGPHAGFILWDVYPAVFAAKDEVAKLVAREVSA